jgi:DNA polymerase sigma
MEQKKMPNNININKESSSKAISLDNIRTNNTLNFPNNMETISKNNFINNYINIPIISNVYTSYTPSEKFFDSLTSEIKNYNTITLSNISKLNPIKNKYLNEVETLIKSELQSKYEIKYGHYGSHFTNLSIEGSDVDILIYYKNKDQNNKEFFKDILSVLNQHEDKFLSIQSILTASVPVIKLQICIKNEIKDIKFEHMGYLEGYWEFDKINFDLTFTQNEQEYLHSQQIVDYINKSINTYPMITYLLLILKRYFKIMKMNKSFHGGLSSFSLYLLILSFCKKFPTDITSKGKALFSFLGMFSFFEFDKLGIDVEHSNIFYYLNNTITINNNNNNNSEESFSKKEINIKDPLTKLNVAKSSFRVDDIQTTFRIAYDFLRTEGCYYDYAVFVHKTGYDTDFYNQIKNNYDIFDTTDFKIIKKMFTLNKKQFFCDFFAN